MALTEERFAADGASRIFTPSTTILSQNHIRVDYYLDKDPEETFYIIPDEWDLVNNSVIFKTPPESGKVILISISTTGEDLNEPLSAVQIVADIKEEIQELAEIKEDIIREARFGMLIHTTTIKDDITLKEGNNAISVGPIVIDEDVDVDVEDGSKWQII